MKKFFTLVATALVAMNLSAEPVEVFTTEGELEVELGGAWSWVGKDLPDQPNFDASAYDYIWIEYDVEENALEDFNDAPSWDGGGEPAGKKAIRFGTNDDGTGGYSTWTEDYRYIDGEYGIQGIPIRKEGNVEFALDTDNQTETEHPQKAHPNAGDPLNKHCVLIFFQPTEGFNDVLVISHVYFGTEADFKAARKKAGYKSYVYPETKNVLEGLEMESYIRNQIGPDGAVAQDQPCNGGVEDGVATINVRSKEAALGDNPTFSQWYGSWSADDPSTETAENVATWDTQGFIKLPKKFNANDKISVSMDVKAEKAISGVSVGCHNIPGQYQSGFANAPALNIGTTWSTYTIPERLISEVGCDAANFGSIAFDLTIINDEVTTSTANVVQFKNVKVMISEAVEEGDGITTVYEMTKNGWVRYNLAGQKVDKSYKGVVIENGKKFVQK